MRLLLLLPVAALSVTVDLAEFTEAEEQWPVRGNKHHNRLRKASSSLITNNQSACRGRGPNVKDDEFLKQCPACRLTGMKKPRIYIVEPKDGLGSRLHDILAGMAVAAKMGMSLGGITFGKRTCQESHGVDIMKTAGLFFGLKNTRLMFTDHPPKFDQVWPGVRDFEKGMRKYGLPKKQDNIFITNHCVSCELDKVAHSMSEYFTPELLHELRKGTQLKDEPLQFAEGATSIAIHVRRGDVDATDELRGTSDEFYFALIDQLKMLVPDSDIHIFSSLEGKRHDSEFDVYRQRGTTVHLDGDVLEPWAHFAMADVLVTAKSSFSHVPAFLNGNCVVYQPYWHRPLDDWVPTTTDAKEPLSTKSMQALVDCVARVKPR